jgi:hypothetical protein
MEMRSPVVDLEELRAILEVGRPSPYGHRPILAPRLPQEAPRQRGESAGYR